MGWLRGRHRAQRSHRDAGGGRPGWDRWCRGRSSLLGVAAAPAGARGVGRGLRAAEPGPRAPGWQVPAPQPRPAALSAASWPAPRGPNALRVRLPLPGWCAPRSCVTPDSCPGLRAGAGALMAASGNQVSWPKLSPFVSLCVCGSGGLTAAAPLLGGFRCGNRWRRAPRRVTWWRGPRTGPRSDPDPPPSHPGPSSLLRKRTAGARGVAALRGAREVGRAPAPQGRAAGEGVGDKGRRRRAQGRRAIVNRYPGAQPAARFQLPGWAGLSARGARQGRAGPGPTSLCEPPQPGLGRTPGAAVQHARARRGATVGVPARPLHPRAVCYCYFNAVTCRAGRVLRAVGS